MTKTTACSACGGVVAIGAATCPHCGKDWPAGMTQGQAATTLFVAVPVIAVVLAIGTKLLGFW